MRIALLGAGHIGGTIARLLAESDDYQLTVVDCSKQALLTVAGLPLVGVVADLSDRPTLAALLQPADLVINALPFHLAAYVADIAKQTRTHYFDLTEDVRATREIAALAHMAETAFMPQCGLAPGFVSIAANQLAASFEQVQDIKMRVGALPEFPCNALKYNLTWSIDGLINEYCHPCEALQDGHKVTLAPMEGLEYFSVDGVEYEAFNTSGGLGTLCETLASSIQNLDYKSIRYPGHQLRMKFLLDELGLKHDPALLKSILRKSIPTTMQDVVLVFISVTGMRAGKFVQEVFSRKIFSRHEHGRYESAIERTTAAGMCTAVDLFAAGKLPQSGFIRQEQIGLADFLNNRFGQVFARSQI